MDEGLGGPLVIHEMVQLPEGGRIGTKWMDELVPAISPDVITLSGSSDKIEKVPSGSFLLTFDVTPVASDGKLTVNLLPSVDRGIQDACEWKLDNGENVRNILWLVVNLFVNALYAKEVLHSKAGIMQSRI